MWCHTAPGSLHCCTLTHTSYAQIQIWPTSALQTDLFSSFFGGCPILQVPGRTFAVAEHFLDTALELTGWQPPVRTSA